MRLIFFSAKIIEFWGFFLIFYYILFIYFGWETTSICANLGMMGKFITWTQICITATYAKDRHRQRRIKTRAQEIIQNPSSPYFGLSESLTTSFHYLPDSCLSVDGFLCFPVHMAKDGSLISLQFNSQAKLCLMPQMKFQSFRNKSGLV